MTIFAMKDVAAALRKMPGGVLAPARDGGLLVRGGLVGEAMPSNDDNGRVIVYKFSTGDVVRDGNRINQNGWELDNFRKNPVFLWAHDADEPPIGRVPEIGVVNGVLQGPVVYATADEYPFADTIYRLVKGKYLNACSVSWMPLTWKFSADKSRPGGIDFLTQELWEISQVPLPADPNALVVARSAGIDTGPIFEWAERILDRGGSAIAPRPQLEALRSAARMASGKQNRAVTPDWKVGAARELPVSTESSWDGPAAAERMLDAAGFNGDSPDAEKAARGFLAYDSANPTLKGSFKLPFADIVDGELTAVKGGLDAAAQRLSQTDVPQAVRDEAQTVIDGYESKMKDAKSARTAPKRQKRGLYTVSYLADVLGALAYIQMSSQQEETWEQDDSKVPAMLLDALKQLGAALVAMTAEEVNEMLAGCDVDPIADGEAYVASAKTPAQRLLRTLEMKFRAAAAPAPIVMRAPDAKALAKLQTILGRSGRVLSKANEEKLRAAHGQISDACDMIMGVVEQSAEDDDDDDGAGGGDDESAAARAARERSARARQRRARLNLENVGAE